MKLFFNKNKQKKKVRKCLRRVKEFLRRFDLASGKYLSIFHGFFARIFRVSHFAQAINFPGRFQGKVHPRKVNKTNKETTRLIKKNDLDTLWK